MDDYSNINEACNAHYWVCAPHKWSEDEKKQLRICIEKLRRREHVRAKEHLMHWLKNLKDPMDLTDIRKEVSSQLANLTGKSKFSYMYGLHIFSRAIYRGLMNHDDFNFLSDDKQKYLKALTSTEAILQEQSKFYEKN